MDDLDRLYDRLATNVRDGFPHLLDRAFQLGDIGEHLVPYRLNRRELGFDSVRQYELALMRLASGERGLLRADAAVQEAFRRALASPEPDGALLRDHARAAVALNPAGTSTRATTQAASAPAAQAPSGPAPASPAPSATGVFGPPPAQPIFVDGPAAAANAPAPAPPPSAPTAEHAPLSDARAMQPPPAVEPSPDSYGVTPSTFGAGTPAWTEPSVSAEPTAPVGSVRYRTGRDVPLEPRPGPTVIGGPCRYCGQALPEGRAVTFCPHCGQNVTVQQCPACSTELEIGWRYCITCGRAMDEAALAAPRR